MSAPENAHSADRTTPQGEALSSAALAERASGTLPNGVGGDGAVSEPAAETEIWTGRTHWKHYAGRLSVWLLANLAFAVLITRVTPHVGWLNFRRSSLIVLVVLALSGLEIVIRKVVLKILKHRYRLTTQRLFIERGIVSQTVDQTELIRVDDVRLYKSFQDRLFGLGSVALVTTDATDREIVIEGIAQPEQVAEAVRAYMRTLRRKSLFVENL